MKSKHYLEEELFLLIKKNNEVFDFIQDFALDGLWYWDLDNPNNEWMNKKFWLTLGYEPGELPYSPSSWNKLVYEKDLNKINKQVNKYLKNPINLFNSTVRYRHKNGSILWIKCYGKLFKDKNGKFNRFLGAHQNITELKQHEINLEKSNSIANIGFWEFDIENKEFNFNILDILIVNIIYTGEQLSLFIRKDDSHYFLPFSETMLKEYSNSSVSSLVDDFLNFPFYNIPISSYVSNFLSNKNDVRHNSFTMILTEQESKLLKIIRKNFEKIKQLKVKYKTGNIELIEVTTIKKVALESKIINHIKKADYKKITIDIANGSIVNFEDTEKIKI